MDKLNFDLLHYGQYLFDDSLYTDTNQELTPVRIRIIKYQNKLYLHRMEWGNLVEIKELV